MGSLSDLGMRERVGTVTMPLLEDQTGGWVWDASHTLKSFVCADEEVLRSRPRFVCELGAGTGDLVSACWPVTSPPIVNTA
jgi:hypothetical protein